jgi:hypothetical protein
VVMELHPILYQIINTQSLQQVFNLQLTQHEDCHGVIRYLSKVSSICYIVGNAENQHTSWAPHRAPWWAPIWAESTLFIDHWVITTNTTQQKWMKRHWKSKTCSHPITCNFQQDVGNFCFNNCKQWAAVAAEKIKCEWINKSHQYSICKILH